MAPEYWKSPCLCEAVIAIDYILSRNSVFVPGVFNSAVLVQQQTSALNMAFPKHSTLRALTLLLLAGLLVRCQAPLDPEEEEEEEETNITTVVSKPEVFECPAECSCTAEGAVDCAGVDLTEFPPELPERTRQLSLQV